MAWPVVTVASGGLAVTDAGSNGTPIEEATNGFGTAVTFIASGGMPVSPSKTYLLRDFFNGDGSLVGRLPDIGPAAWVPTGPSFDKMVTQGGEMFQNDIGAGSAYGTLAASSTVAEVGCTFRCGSAVSGLALSGAPSNGALIGVNVYPSRSAVFIQVTYTLIGTDTLASAATALAAAISSNSQMISAGVSATANGARVLFASTNQEAPKLASFSAGSVSLLLSNTATPTLASYVTGQNFAQEMIHFILGVDGSLFWSVFIGGVNTGLQSYTSKVFRGLKPGLEYTYRCCIAPPYIWGGVWDGTTLVSAAYGQDDRISARNGASGFWETAGASEFFYREIWALKSPSVSRSSIADAVAG